MLNNSSSWIPSAEPLSKTTFIADAANRRLPTWCWVTGAVLALVGCSSANPWLTPAAIAILIICIQLTWRVGEPPVLAFACSMQWLQASAAIFYADFFRMTLEEVGGGREIVTATWLSLLAVLVLAIGMRVALLRCRESRHRALTAEATRTNIRYAFTAYLVCFFIGSVAERFAFEVPGIGQLIFALVALKWTTVFVAIYAVVEKRQGYLFLAGIVAIELAIGMLGFFSNFKSVLFILLVVAMTSPLALRGRRLALAVGAALTLFVLGVVWSAVKAEYREILNQGSGQQAVTISMDTSAHKLADLIGNFSWDQFVDGIDSLTLRVGYTRLFALTLLNVPEHVPYEHGALWLGAIEHIAMPRLLFPNKAPLDDSDRTSLYTGVQVAGTEEGTDISIGYVAESYVDFGSIGMFVPIFILGVFCGLIYRFLVIESSSKLVATAMASVILIFGAFTIETSNVKIVGGMVTQLLVMGTLYLIFGRVFRGWLENRAA